MPDKYSEALNLLERISMSGSKPGLGRINKLLSLFGNPQKKIKCAIVAGTNGKGSTTNYLSKILEADGHKTGSFFSPHILSFRERIQINSKPISKKDFAKVFFEVYEKCKNLSDKPTFFEVMTAMAVLYFSKKNCEYAVLETGMGGRLDATNACEPVVSIITNISLEHTRHLGNTIDKIAHEKAGIMRKGKPIVCGANGDDFQILKKLAKEKGAKFHSIKNKFIIKKKTKTTIEILFNFENSFSAKLKTTADFLIKNCACAVLAAQILGVGNKKIILGIEGTKLFGRWGKISNSPNTTIDCAHNLGAFIEIEPMLKNEFSRGKSVLLFCAMKDKNYFAELKLLSKYFDEIVLCTLSFERAQSAKILESTAKKSGFKKTHAIKNANDAYSLAKKLCAKNKKLLVTGSIYLLQELFADKENSILG